MGQMVKIERQTVLMGREALGQIFKEDLPRVLKTYQQEMIASEQRKRQVDGISFDLGGSIFFIRRGRMWGRFGISTKRAPTIEGAVKSFLPALFTNLSIFPATADLMKRAEDSPTTESGIWAVVAFGLTEKGEMLPPTLFYPQGFSAKEALRVMVRVEEIQRSYSGIT